MQQLKQLASYFGPRRPHYRWHAIAVTIGIAIGLMAVSAVAAKAADKGGITKKQAEAEAPVNIWSGCALGAYVGVLPDGSMLGVTSNCDVQNGKAVVGLLLSYGASTDYLKGGDRATDLTVGGRVGYLLWPSALVYGLAAWSRLNDEATHIDGYKLGGGVEVRLPDSPIFIDMRATRGWYDSAAVEVNEVRLGATYKLNFVK